MDVVYESVDKIKLELIGDIEGEGKNQKREKSQRNIIRKEVNEVEKQGQEGN